MIDRVHMKSYLLDAPSRGVQTNCSSCNWSVTFELAITHVLLCTMSALLIDTLHVADLHSQLSTDRHSSNAVAYLWTALNCGPLTVTGSSYTGKEYASSSSSKDPEALQPSANTDSTVGTVGIALAVGGVTVAIAIAFTIVFILALCVCMLKLGVW